MVTGTFLSALLMFISAKMMDVMVDNAAHYENILLDASFDVSIISMVCCVSVYYT